MLTIVMTTTCFVKALANGSVDSCIYQRYVFSICENGRGNPACVDSKFRDEFLNEHEFWSLGEARAVIDAWALRLQYGATSCRGGKSHARGVQKELPKLRI